MLMVGTAWGRMLGAEGLGLVLLRLGLGLLGAEELGVGCLGLEERATAS